ncbi:hypothetical protein Nham_4126 (plasmid) [Nitrobacter hamburgensis X14]|uniref:Uncharacterized protein n=1 Tax=Nitrobacter hamburgensis (strain DSM 10229 / NCIMB 13809 / X14) TaxID=323097 RepID=Q1QG78_NITHX|nr:hypothetical protein Nham_4126 [Nitrobacter hamburgensis X14]
MFKASNSKTESRSLQCRLTTPPDQPRHPKSRIAPKILARTGASAPLIDGLAFEGFIADKAFDSKCHHCRVERMGPKSSPRSIRGAPRLLAAFSVNRT